MCFIKATFKFKCRTQNSLSDKIIECNSAIISKEEKILKKYEQNFQEIDDLSHMFNLLFTQKSDFDKQSFIISQNINYPMIFKKAENKRSLKFVIDNGILKYKSQDTLKIVLPQQIIVSTFINLHQRGLHNMDTIVKSKLLHSFYIPVKIMNKSIKAAIRTCTNCNILNPKSQKKFIGLKRSLKEHLASGKHIFVDITYLKVINETYYLLF